MTFPGSMLMNMDLGGVPVTDTVRNCSWRTGLCIRHRQPRPGGSGCSLPAAEGSLGLVAPRRSLGLQSE